MKRTDLIINQTRRAVIVSLSAVIMSLLAVNHDASAADGGRITTSVELKHVQPLLRRVARLTEKGFGRAEADRVSAEIRAMPANQPRSWSFQIQYEQGNYPLEVRALLDELGTVDLDFATQGSLTAAVRNEVDTYLNAHNL